MRWTGPRRLRSIMARVEISRSGSAICDTALRRAYGCREGKEQVTITDTDDGIDDLQQGATRQKIGWPRQGVTARDAVMLSPNGERQ